MPTIAQFIQHFPTVVRISGCINHFAHYQFRSTGQRRPGLGGARSGTLNVGSEMAEEMHRVSQADLLPVWQRIAWMAAIWLVSVGMLAVVSWLVSDWIDR